MRRLLALCAVLTLLCLPVLAAEGFVLEERETAKRFPETGDTVYDYQCRYPFVTDKGFVAEEINNYFTAAVEDMTLLVLPMYAADEKLAAEGLHIFHQQYEVTCNNGRHFSTLMRQQQTVEGQVRHSLHSMVFDVSGAYQGETLTLRGLVNEVGDSSVQIAHFIFEDVWAKIQEQQQSGESPLTGITKDKLAQEFFPDNHFYADEDSRAVFYLQPSLTGQADQPVTFTYTSEDIDSLIAKGDKP